MNVVNRCQYKMAFLTKTLQHTLPIGRQDLCHGYPSRWNPHVTLGQKNCRLEKCHVDGMETAYCTHFSSSGTSLEISFDTILRAKKTAQDSLTRCLSRSTPANYGAGSGPFSHQLGFGHNLGFHLEYGAPAGVPSYMLLGLHNIRCSPGSFLTE